jgi:methylenetetrahydrofolate dehydrogenase (NADP+) / methenyltetrahydrofolate cyclohydrolase
MEIERPMAILLDGKIASQSVLGQLKLEVDTLAIKPGLAAVLVGENPASKVYVARKVKIAHEVGLYSELHPLPEQTTEEALLTLIDSLNQNPAIHGILVQLPLPQHIREERILDRIALHKDVDGFHPTNMGRLLAGLPPSALPCTPAGMMTLLDFYEVPLAGRHAVVVGRSNIVGKPASILLLNRDATVTMAHSKTQDLPQLLRQADIIVAAVGRPHMIQAEHVKPGAVILDVGINRLPDGKLVGDVDFESVSGIAEYITPVPGGIGPMTIATLMQNTVRLSRLQSG